VRHNIVEDPLDVLGPGSFDLVCAWLVLFWLAGRQEAAIHNMVKCVRPGGWLVDEEGDWGVPRPVDLSHPLYSGYHHAFRAGTGGPPVATTHCSGARCLPFRAVRLAEHRQSGDRQMVRGGSPWARWWRQNLDVIRAWGLTSDGPAEAPDKEHQALTAPCRDPSVWFITELLHPCTGQRPS
jgi:SAM-dependent methyltransferase